MGKGAPFLSYFLRYGSKSSLVPPLSTRSDAVPHHITLICSHIIQGAEGIVKPSAKFRAHGTVRLFSLLALPLILLYNGKRGKLRLKYFFYAFYPLHLALLAAIYLALNPAYLSALFA